MHMHSSKTTTREKDQQANKKNGLKQGESSLGMPVALMTSHVATFLPTPLIGTTSTMVPIVASILEETPTVITTSHSFDSR